jgi:NAD(P)-dependent dehydrogenase (short-subunit alcohol dehydrogenase family)
MKKIILVTGGNRGIGLGICEQLIQVNHTVIMGTRDHAKGLEAAKSLPESIDVQPLDITNEDHMESLTAHIKRTHGRLDVLINNAGIISSKQGIVEADLTEVKEILETNFFGPWKLSQLMFPLLKKGKKPHIINMSSGMGELFPLKSNYIGYRISKTFLNRLTLLLAEELKPDGIKVNAMCPGWVRTDMGGKDATRSVTKGAETAVWLASNDETHTGEFFRDRKVIEW